MVKDGVGCTLAVDLEYANKLHDEHKDLPRAHEKLDGKLIPHFIGRKEHPVYYKFLEKYRQLGLRI